MRCRLARRQNSLRKLTAIADHAYGLIDSPPARGKSPAMGPMTSSYASKTSGTDRPSGVLLLAIGGRL
jgi:hypothetical protein